jgi:hypothetical protein
MADLIILRVETIIKDDGRDGIFFRNGERWLRERGVENRLLDLAPNLELALISGDMLSVLDKRALAESAGEEK